MNRIVIGALGIGLLVGGAAMAGGDPVSKYMGDCGASQSSCVRRATDVVVNGQNSHFICIPKGTTTDDAVQQEVEWLKKTARENPRFADTDMEDALWDGAAKLWPCRKA
jgi:hypothetical protein